jgi:methionyl-tRNA formyltransferase
MRLLFMGTPEFAVPTLHALIDAGHEIVAVVTAPDRNAGRGRKAKASAVKQAAEKAGLPVLQPTNLKAQAFIDEVRALKPDLAVVVAFRMLPKLVWEIPRLGTMNLHAALLPDYRGAAPINWVLINGETRTGATTFIIDETIDTGGILMFKSLQIPPEWNAGDLHDELMRLGARLVVESVEKYGKGEIEPEAQDPERARHLAPKLAKEDGHIDFDVPAVTAHNLIRGLSPYPGAFTHLEGRTLKVLESRPAPEVKTEPEPRRLLVNDAGDRIFASAEDGWLELLEVQLEGRKRLTARQFLNGYGALPDYLEAR